MTPLALPVAALVAGLVLLYFGAEGLVRGAGSLALRLGMTPLVAGLTVVAFGTSMPELVVSLKAAFAGSGDIAVGNIVGSNIANVALILGIAALISPLAVRFQLIRFDVPVMVGSLVIAVVFLWDGRTSFIEGAVLTSLLLAYIVASLIIARRSRTAEIDAEFAEAVPEVSRGGMMVDILLIVGGGAGLVFGARFLVDGAVTIATALGVGKAVIGLTVVAVGTSLPELAATAVAAMKREADIAVGNVIGSNIFNVFCILGVSSLIIPLEASGIGHFDLFFMLGLGLLLFPLMRSGFVLKRWEGAVLLAIYAIYIAVTISGVLTS